VTLLDEDSLLVLGYDWLKGVNLSIDWSKGTICLIQIANRYIKQDILLHLSHNCRKPITYQAPAISLIGIAAFGRACRQQGTVLFQLISIDLEPASGISSILFGDNLDLS